MGLAPLADVVVTDCDPVFWLRVAGLPIVPLERAHESLIGLEGSPSDGVGLHRNAVAASMKGTRDDLTVVIDVADELLR